ncbi:MAG: calcium-binding protein [Hyphomicrobium sp.]
MFKFNAFATPIVDTPDRLVFAGPSNYFPASTIAVQVRFNGSGLSISSATGTLSGTVTSVELWDATNNVVLQTMQVGSSTAMVGRINVFLNHAMLIANNVESWFGGNFDHVDTAGIVYGGTTMIVPVLNSSNAVLGYLNITGTGLTSAGLDTAIIKSIKHENASHALVVGESVTYGTLGVTANYFDYGLLPVTNGLNGHADPIDRIMTAGNDTFVATGRIGTLDGGLGNDIYALDSFTPTITDTGGIDTITSSITRSLAALTQIENLTLIGTGNVNSTGNGLANILIGNAGNNTIDGGLGDDTMDGAAGNDTLTGGAGVDKLTGGLGVDSLSGGDGKDLLTGGDGNDTLNGGLLRDAMSGGTGADKFVFSVAADMGKTALTRDTISDFTHNTTLALSDRIDLSAIDASTKIAGNNAFTWAGKVAFTGVAGQLHYLVSDAIGTANDKTIVEGDYNGDKIADFQIELAGMKALVAADFVL